MLRPEIEAEEKRIRDEISDLERFKGRYAKPRPCDYLLRGAIRLLWVLALLVGTFALFAAQAIAGIGRYFFF